MSYYYKFKLRDPNLSNRPPSGVRALHDMADKEDVFRIKEDGEIIIYVKKSKKLTDEDIEKKKFTKLKKTDFDKKKQEKIDRPKTKGPHWRR